MKKVISIILVVVMLCSTFAGLQVTSSAAVPGSGKCGANVSYTFDSATGTLTISGSGAMYNHNQYYYYYDYYKSPFYNQTGIKTVVIENGVTSIGNYAFFGCIGLTGITIPNSVTSIGYVAFYGCSGLTSVTIPNSVTSIGDYAFYGCSGLTSIVVASGNTKYDSRNNCNAIIETATNTLIQGCKNTVIPDSVTSIGDYAFYGCSGLTSITIPDSVTSIGGYAFYGCSGLTSVSIPNSVTSIGTSVFEDCSGLTSVSIPNSVTSIGGNAFSGCSGLTSVTIGNSVTSIGNSAFRLCSGLTSITIGNSVRDIGTSAFEDCSGLTSVSIPNSVTSIANSAFRLCSGLKSVVIPDAVTDIGNYAFEGCKSLKNIRFGKGVKSVGFGAFNRCEALQVVNAADLESWCKIRFYDADSNPLRYSHILYVDGNIVSDIQIPASVNAISDYAFYRCRNIKSVSIPSSVEIIGRGAFEECTALQSVKFSESLKSIKDAAFAGCAMLENIFLPDSLESLGDNNPYYYYSNTGVFSNCKKLKSVGFGSHITGAGNNTFNGCEALEEVHISNVDTWAQLNFITETSNPLFYAGKLYLNDEELTDLIISDEVSDIGEHAFENCSNIKNISIGKNVRTIGNTSFKNALGIEKISVANENRIFDSRQGCNALIETHTNTLVLGTKNTVIPSDVETIGMRAFAGCEGLESINVPDGVERISDYAFSNCKALKTVYIGATCSQIGYDVFSACESLESITVSNDNRVYDSRENSNALIETATNSLIHGSASTVIPDSIITIENLAFATLQGLEKINIPTGVIAIGHSAFADCRNLKQLYIENGVMNIGYSAFEGCRNLKQVSIPESVSNIESRAFWNCPRLEKICINNPECVICDSVNTISNKATMVAAVDSTAYDYAMNYNMAFLDSDSEEQGEHRWDAGVVTKPATCHAEGVITYTCLDCAQTKQEAIPKTAHQYEHRAVKATCISQGFTVYTCANCGDTYRADYVPVTGSHDYIATTAKAATCSQTGTKTFTCSVCGDLYTEAIPMKAHTVVSDSAVAPTCTKYGLSAGKYCAECGKVFELQEKLEPLGHDFGAVVTRATLTANGVIAHPCSRCDKAGASEVIYAPKTFTLAKTSYVYSGKAIAPAVTVKDAKGNVLKKGTDYTVAYKANKAIGTASAVITFKGNYKGTKTLAFTIVPKATNLALAGAKKAFTAKWTKVAGVTGYQIQYATNAKFTGAKTVNVKGASKAAQAVKNLKGGAKYYVRIRTYKTAGGKNYFSAWSAAKAVITKK